MLDNVKTKKSILSDCCGRKGKKNVDIISSEHQHTDTQRIMQNRASPKSPRLRSNTPTKELNPGLAVTIDPEIVNLFFEFDDRVAELSGRSPRNTPQSPRRNNRSTSPDIAKKKETDVLS